jgi:WD40 repeat protein/serine/threonine protein kinase
MAESRRDLEAIFFAARQKPPQERAAFLDQVCGDDLVLRERAEQFLSAQAEIGSFLESGASHLMAAAEEQPSTDRPGTVIGAYKLMEQIGEGGMGLVFVAEQQRPIHRKVALKLIKPGMDTRQVIARFEAERQALALMDHPNIAKVHDGGETASGRPYFVMELVKGVPITVYGDDNQVPIRARLELFVHVCQAVQHAHQKGIIHRDLKPSNVLVMSHDGTPQVKVIDFGVAKAVGQQLTDKTIYTQFSQLVGTPLYMSPEQAGQSGVDVDTRSDIYSLGVLLYELLTGATPFDKERLRQADYEEIRRIMREEEPPRPSTRLSTLGQAATITSAQRQSDPRRLSQLLRGELDWIVMKALEKDRNRRYETASAFAADVQRYLHDEPVQACPPSAGYRLRKFARRNKAPLLASGVVLLLALVSLGVVFWVREQARKRLELQLYYQTVGLADHERALGAAGRAEQLLDGPECPEHVRGWEWHYLKRLRFGCVAPVPHPCLIWCLAVSRDGRWLAVGGKDGWVRLRDVKSGREARSFQAHSCAVRALTFSPDSRRLASGSTDENTVKVWSVPTGELLASRPNGGGTMAVAFSPDGGTLVSAGDPCLKVWDAATWHKLPAPPGCEEQVLGLAFSPDGRRLAAGMSDGTVKVWETATWRALHTLAPHVGPVRCVAFSPDGTRLASSAGYAFTSGDECEIKIWDAASGQLIHTLGGHQEGVFSLAFSPDGKRLATTGGEDATIKVWDAANGLEALTLRGHKDTPWGVAFSPDSRVLYSAGTDQTLRIWDGTPLEDDSDPALRTFTGHEKRVTAVAFDPDSHRLVSAGYDRTVRVWDVTTGKQLRKLEPPGLVHSVAFDPRGHLLASDSWDDAFGGGGNGLLKVWDSRTWHELHSLRLDAPGFVSAAFTPDGRRLVTACGDSVVVWDTTAFRPSPVQYDHLLPLTSVAVSPDGRRVASADINGEVRVWDLADGRPVLSILSPPPPVSALVNVHAALLTAQPLHRLRAHTTRATGVAFGPQGDFLATCGMDGATCLWDARTFKRVDELRGHDSGVRCLAFSPDGSRLATGGNDASIRVWDVAARRQLSVLRGHTDIVYSVTFSQDGRYIASGSLDRTVKVWDAQGSAEQHARAEVQAQNWPASLHGRIFPYTGPGTSRPSTGGRP